MDTDNRMFRASTFNIAQQLRLVTNKKNVLYISVGHWKRE